MVRAQTRHLLLYQERVHGPVQMSFVDVEWSPMPDNPGVLEEGTNEQNLTVDRNGSLCEGMETIPVELGSCGKFTIKNNFYISN